MNMWHRFGICASGIFASFSAHAEQAAAFDAPPPLTSIQVTATRQAEPANEVPPALTVLGPDDLKRQSPLTVADYFHGETGTYVQQTGPGQGNVIIRGLKGSEILHLVDGFRLNTGFFRNAPNQHLALVDPLAVERIEAVRGPMSTLYGSDAMGGVIQFLSAEPRYASSEWSSDALVRTRWSSADHSSHSRVAYQGGREGFGVSAGLSYQDGDDVRIGGGRHLPYTGFSQQGADAKLIFTPADGHEFTFSTQYSKQPRTPRHDTLVPGYGQVDPDNAEFLYQPQERRFAQVRYRHTNPSALADRIDVQVGYQKMIDDRSSREFGSANREIERNASTLEGLSMVARKDVGAHHFGYGIEYYRDTIDSFRERLNIDTGVISARPSRYPDGSNMDSLALFVSDDWRIGPRLDLLAGLRYSRFDIELPPVINGIGVKLTPEDTTGQLGFAYELADGLHLVGNAGRGFRAPNVFDLGTFGDRPSNRFNIPNPALKPESVNSIDFGLKHAAGNLEFETIAFRSRYKDKITSVLTGEQTESGRDIVQSRNATRLDLWGFESGLRWRASDALGVRASLTWTRGDETYDGDEYPADRIPPLFGRVGLTWTPHAHWELEGWTLFASRQDRLSPRDAVDARIDPSGTAGWATLNARVAWRAQENLDLQFLLENIADKRYREHGSGLDEPGRNFVFAIERRF
jgi:TonB-dependent heme/hemoglobin receptor